MDLVARLKDNERNELFSETAAVKRMTPAVVEKDFWVTWTLGKIFINPALRPILKFKGGTSLSKVYGLIERFSEDIDLILNWEILTKEDPLMGRSKKKQIQLNEEIREAARVYIAEELLGVISESVEPICHCEVDKHDRNMLNLYYPKAFSDDYIRPEIRLEIGPLASWLPFDEHLIKSYAAEVFPHVFEKPECLVQVIKAERTFWEKATILHHEAHRPEGSIQPPRNSRHYYDMAQMAMSSVKVSALADLSILESVVEFKKRFYPRGWANYDLAKPGTLRLIPQGHVLESFKNDYKAMRNMIYGEYPEYSKILHVLAKLEDEINAL
ncbi:MAG: nucleotidyl transferase AbiEii/AbiGii toxin family protein [Proteobacteria bacterium]|nr:nucleotidyl transferase AbiEii/AbiGii toxin family protein [Pseudomonadota bacterium]MBU4294713.1 nucleotidyl transferase AbiEii/AbiGii toxin family protein [Pseudomonadota bacterium]MCG2746303.1 nucleotidyl transferase AbiEii/AbiGii toxin family protein [Desulfobulbaceae bacterium]